MDSNICSLSIPNKIIFGSGSYNNLISEVLQFKAKKVLIISNRSVVKDLEEKLKAEGIETLTYSPSRREPDLEIVNECLRKTIGFNPDLCIGLGGGSVLDTAKFISWIKGNNCTEIKDLKDISFSKRGIPMIMIPTTSGTGSEATPNAIFLDKEKKKQAIVSRNMIPEIAIIDPELMLSLPPELTALTGIDALSHCVESYLSTNGSQWVDEIAVRGAKLVYKSLHAAINNSDSIESREDMAMASFLGGVALTNAGTCSVHALAYPLAKYGVSHSQGVSILYPYVLIYHDSFKVKKIDDLKNALDIFEIEDLINPVIQGLKIAKCPYNLKDLSIKEDDIKLIVEEAFLQERLLKNNPISLSKADIESIYMKALNGDLN